MPPMNCERAVLRVDDRGRRRTRRAAANADLAACRCRHGPRRTARRTRGARAGSGALIVVGGVGPTPRSRRRGDQRLAAPRTTAEPQEAVPMEPPATAPRRRRCRRSRARRARASTPSASAAIWVSTVRAPVPMSAAAISTVNVPSALERAPWPWTARGRRGRSRRRRRCRSASARRGARPGVGSRSAQPKRCGALAQAGDEVAELNGMPALGVGLGLVADRAARSGRARRRRPARPWPTPARTCPGHSPGARIHDGVGTSSATSRWARAAVGRRVHHARRGRGLLGELAHGRGLLEAPRGRSRSAGRRASAPRRTRWIVGVR